MTDFIAIYLLGGILYMFVMCQRYGLKPEIVKRPFALFTSAVLMVMLWPISVSIHLFLWRQMEDSLKRKIEARKGVAAVKGKSFEQMVKENEGRQ